MSGVEAAAIKLQDYLLGKVKDADWKGQWLEAWEAWGTVINTLTHQPFDV